MLMTSCGNEGDNNTTSGDENTEITEALQENTSVTETALPDNETTLPENELAVNLTASDRVFYGRKNDAADTFTGLEPLSLVEYKIDSVSGEYSKEMISHSYGVAEGEKPHNISIGYQQFFEDGNFDAVCYDTKSAKKVLYLTFDCGYENGYTAKILDVLKNKNVPAAFFCTLPQVKDNQQIIARMINEGHIVGNHSVTHPDFSTLSVEKIVDEIKGFDDYIRENFGYSSLYFRFPQGKYSEHSLKAVNELGFKCVFWSLAYADWDLSSQKGADFAYNTVMERIHPGAVILLHAVSPDNANALERIIDSCREKGYEFCSLESLNK